MANPAQPESIVTNESAAARLSAVLLYVLLHCSTAVLGRSVGGWWVVGEWWTAACSLPEMAEYRQKMKLPPSVCFLFHARSSRTNQITAPRVPGVLLYVLLQHGVQWSAPEEPGRP